MAKSNANASGNRQHKSQNASHEGGMKNKSTSNERPRDAEGRFTSKSDSK